MHHRVVELRVELLPERFGLRHAQLFKRLAELVHDHLHALAVGLVLRALVERADQIVIHRQKLRHGVGLDVGIEAVLFLLAALAVVVILREQP